MSYRFAARRPFPRRIVWSIWWFCVFVAVTPAAQGYLQPQDLLLVVNDDSPTSKYVANLYRQYYPSITDNQIVHLSGLPDAAVSTTNEIINRSTFDTNIASPIRQHLVNNGLVNSTKAIVTTAGLPYRIKDDTHPSVVMPNSCTPYPTSETGNVQAASVESELTMLFQLPGSGSPSPLPLNNRVVNPYQGYRGSSISDFRGGDFDLLSRRSQFHWDYPSGSLPPVMEGTPDIDGMYNRKFSAGDIYLTCRLDAPKNLSGNPWDTAFSVHDMLERARRASSDQFGIDPDVATVVMDDAPNCPSGNINRNPIRNLEKGTAYLTHSSGQPPQPPDTTLKEIHDDYNDAFKQLAPTSSWSSGVLNHGGMTSGHNVEVLLDKRNNTRATQSDIPGKAVVALTGFGVNGDESTNPNYIKTGGPGGGALFETTYGAVFNSLESFNAVTMFDVATGIVPQGKIADFIGMGGSGAIGHVFEPLAESTVDNEYFIYNLLADQNQDGYADLTFVEAAFSGIPYLSWSEVVIGDPLMRIAYGPGGLANPSRLLGDVNLDGYVNEADVSATIGHIGGIFGDSSGLYLDTADIDRNGQVTSYDIWYITKNLGQYDPLAFGNGGGQIPEPGIFFLISLGIAVKPYFTRTKKSNIF